MLFASLFGGAVSRSRGGSKSRAPKAGEETPLFGDICTAAFSMQSTGAPGKEFLQGPPHWLPSRSMKSEFRIDRQFYLSWFDFYFAVENAWQRQLHGEMVHRARESGSESTIAGKLQQQGLGPAVGPCPQLSTEQWINVSFPYLSPAAFR